MKEPKLHPKQVWTPRPFSKRRREWKGNYKAERYHHGEIVYEATPGRKKGEPPQ